MEERKTNTKSRFIVTVMVLLMITVIGLSFVSADDYTQYDLSAEEMNEFSAHVDPEVIEEVQEELGSGTTAEYVEEILQRQPEVRQYLP